MKTPVSRLAGTRRNESMFLLLLTLTSFATLVSWSASAQDKTADIDKLFTWASPSTPGCSCAISQNGKTVAARAYGSADLERGTPINPESAFDIGSTRKQFIAAAVLLLVEEKRIALSDDVRKYIPQLPDYGRKVTVDHLLTHTSGIRDWTGFLRLANGDPTALSMILKQRALNFIPGDEWSYSNSGFVLLVELVERVTKQPFSEFARTRLFEPLGMKSTRYVADMQQVVSNRALGYSKDGNSWKVNMYLGNDRGGGAIFSTAGDLLTWNEALTKGKLGQFATQKLQEPAVLNNGRTLGYARGLALDPYRDSRLIWHSGGAAGYHTWLGRIPSQGLSMAILCNSDAMSATSIANRLLALYYHSGAAPVPEDGPPPTLTGEELADINKYAGLFFSEKTGDPLTLSVDRDRFRVAGGPGLAPLAKGRYRRWGNSVFFLSQDQFELNFQSADRFELKSMEGNSTYFRRAKPFAPTATELHAFAGRYKSDELNAFFDMSNGPEGLLGRANESAETFGFKPVDPDTFQLGGVIVRFMRDKTGKVIALDYSNPVVTHIRFTRAD